MRRYPFILLGGERHWQPGLEPGSLDPGTSALTMRSLRLSADICMVHKLLCVLLLFNFLMQRLPEEIKVKHEKMKEEMIGLYNRNI